MRSSDLTIVLEAAIRGDVQAAAQLLPLVYDELHQLARSRISRLPPGQMLQATALVNEACLRLVDDTALAAGDRERLLVIAARMLGVSGRTVDNDWYVARAWLARELADDGESNAA